MKHPATATAAVKVLYLVSCVGQKLTQCPEIAHRTKAARGCQHA